VSHLITWPGNSDVSNDWKPVWDSSSMVLYENSRKMARYAGFRTDEDKNAFFAGERPDLLTVRETSGRENSRLLEVPAGTRWIRLAENQANGWKFRISPSTVWQAVDRAKDASMLMKNDSFDKETSIEMLYNPPLRKIGFFVSGISLFLVFVFQIILTQSERCSVTAGDA
jgi:hypothetical protein